MTKIMTLDSQVYACLPFVSLAKEKSVKLGPVIFWSASHYKEFIEPEKQEIFWSYIQSIGQIKATVSQGERTFINTVKISPEEVTCISIDPSIPSDKVESLLIDSLYLLYFACTFRNLYFGNEIPSFNAFRKMIPAALSFIQSPENWNTLFIKENYREEGVCVHLIDPEICEGFAKLLSTIYAPERSIPAEESTEAYERIIRSIRYLVDRFFPRFVNLVEKGLSFSADLYKPEDVIFLGASFEALLDIHEDDMAADFKHKLRPMLNLKYAKPVELFWKWVDNFYEVKKNIIRGGSDLDANFRLNPNFVIPQTLIGMKLFIYAVYHILYNYRFVSSLPSEAIFKATPIGEILLFFWTEESLLRKIERYLTQLKEETDLDNDTLKEEILFLADLFVMMQEKDYASQGVIFIPTPLEEVKKSILDLINENNSLNLHPRFVNCLTSS